MGFINLIRGIKDKEAAIRFFQNKGIIHTIRKCPKGHEMRLNIDQSMWRCLKTTCRTNINIRKGTWLENSKLPLSTIIFFIFSWSREYTSIKFCQEEFGMGRASIVDWNNFLREVCANTLLSNPTVIGGEGCTVEVDESVFSRRKHNVGKVYPQQWVFGGICRETRECFLYAVPNRSEATLIPIIKECIKPGSQIISDCLRSYGGITKLPGYNFKHQTVNHSKNFVDPSTGAHTNRIEGLWALAKIRNKIHSGTSRNHLDSYLCEFLWRQKFKKC